MPPEYVLRWVPLELLGVVAAVAAGAWLWRSILGPALKRAAAVAKLAEQTFLDWQGEPKRDGVPARPGVMARLATYDERIEGMTMALSEHNAAIEEIRYHIQPNHNGSAHDALVRKLDALAEKIDEQGERQGHLADAQLTVAGQLDRIEQDKRAAHDEILRRIGRIESHRPDGEES